MAFYVNLIQIVVSIALIAAIVLQSKGAGLGGISGSSEGGVFRARRSVGGCGAGAGRVRWALWTANAGVSKLCNFCVCGRPNLFENFILEVNRCLFVQCAVSRS